MGASKLSQDQLVHRFQVMLSRNELNDAWISLKQLLKLPTNTAGQEILNKFYFDLLEQILTAQRSQITREMLVDIPKSPLTDARKLLIVRALEFVGRGNEADAWLQKIQDANIVKGHQTRLLSQHVIDSKLTTMPPNFNPKLWDEIVAIRAAFAAYEAGHDDEAKNHLNQVGLASPLMEWKLLIRGLMAWTAKDDAKAMDNWSRLNSTGYPFSLIEPLYLQIQHLRQLDDQFFTTTAFQKFRVLRGGIFDDLARYAQQGRMQRADVDLKKAEAIANHLKRLSPTLYEQFCRYIYWLTIPIPMPDLPATKTIFFTPVEDAKLLRYRALRATKQLDAKASTLWIEYNKWLHENQAIVPANLYQQIRIAIHQEVIRINQEIMLDEHISLSHLFFATRMASNPFEEAAAVILHQAQLILELDPKQYSALLTIFNVYEQLIAEESVVTRKNQYIARQLSILEAIEKDHFHIAECRDFVLKYYQKNGNQERLIELLPQAIQADPFNTSLVKEYTRYLFQQIVRCISTGDLPQTTALLAAYDRQTVQFNIPEELQVQISAIRAAIDYKQSNLTSYEQRLAALLANKERLTGIFFLFVNITLLKVVKKRRDLILTQFTTELAECQRASQFQSLIPTIILCQLTGIKFTNSTKIYSHVFDRFVSTLLNEPERQAVVKAMLLLHELKCYPQLLRVSQELVSRNRNNPFDLLMYAEGLQHSRKRKKLDPIAASQYIEAFRLFRRLKDYPEAEPFKTVVLKIAEADPMMWDIIPENFA